MGKNLLISIRMLLASMLILGFAYTGLVTVIAKVVSPGKAAGSILQKNGVSVGSEWIAQKFTRAEYFWSRPSAADYATVASGASNQGPLSQALKTAVETRRVDWIKAHGEGVPVPPEMLLASGSGLDPHLSPAAVRAQIGRVAAARKLPQAELEQLVERSTEGPDGGLLGENRVNILRLNIALDGLRAGE